MHIHTALPSVFKEKSAGNPWLKDEIYLEAAGRQELMDLFSFSMEEEKEKWRK